VQAHHCRATSLRAAPAGRLKVDVGANSPAAYEKHPEFLFRTKLLPSWASFLSSVRVGIGYKNRNEVGQRTVCGRKPTVPIREEEIVNVSSPFSRFVDEAPDVRVSAPMARCRVDELIRLLGEHFRRKG
jgi:hypothetical protein